MGTVLRSAPSSRRGARSRSGRVAVGSRAPSQRAHLAGDGQGPVHIEKGEGLPGLLALCVGHRRGYVSRVDRAAEDWRAHRSARLERIEHLFVDGRVAPEARAPAPRSGASVQCSGKTKYTMSSLRNTQVPILKTESPVKDVRNSLLPFYHPHTPGSRDRDAVSPRSLLVDALLLRTLLSGRSLQPPHSPSNQAHRTSPIHPERQHVHSGVH